MQGERENQQKKDRRVSRRRTFPFDCGAERTPPCPIIRYVGSFTPRLTHVCLIYFPRVCGFFFRLMFSCLFCLPFYLRNGTGSGSGLRGSVRARLSAIKIVPGAFAFVAFRDTEGTHTHTLTRFPGRWHGSGKQTHRETPKRWIAIAFFVPRTMMFLPTCVLFALSSKSPTAERSLVNID